MGGGRASWRSTSCSSSMDGMDNPPFIRRVVTNSINTLLDAIYIVPRRIGTVSLRLPAPRPRKEQIYFIGATNVQLEVLDPALTRPGRMGRHVWFRTPTKDDRKDIFDLYLDKVAHEPELDTPSARDEIARITNGYSPAMIDQVCSMALTLRPARRGGCSSRWARPRRGDDDDRVGHGDRHRVRPGRVRATAIHEAGHASRRTSREEHRVDPAVDPDARRLARPPPGDREGGALRRWRSEDMAPDQILGAMAAEHVFYGENTNGVGGDVQTATSRPPDGRRVRHGPEPLDLNGATFADETTEQTESGS